MSNPLSAMLDELMGKHRNAMPDEDNKETTWDDPEVCPYYLSGYCPHEMFVNTKADLGACYKLHDDKLREQYRESPRFEKAGLEDDFLAYLQRIQNDMQRKIDRNKQRLDLTQPGGEVLDADKEQIVDKVLQLSEKISALLSQAEQLGVKGQVEEAQGVVQMMEELKEERDRLQQNLDSPNDLRTMEVCDICGCFLVVNDAQHRLDEHFLGKQHLGFAKIRATVEELLRKKQEKWEQREKELKEVREKQEEERKKSHHSHSSKRKSKSRDRSSRHKSKSRDRSSKHHESSSRKRSRSKDRGRKDQDTKDKPVEREKGRDDKDRRKSNTSSSSRYHHDDSRSSLHHHSSHDKDRRHDKKSSSDRDRDKKKDDKDRDRRREDESSRKRHHGNDKDDKSKRTHQEDSKEKHRSDEKKNESDEKETVQETTTEEHQEPEDEVKEPERIDSATVLQVNGSTNGQTVTVENGKWIQLDHPF